MSPKRSHPPVSASARQSDSLPSDPLVAFRARVVTGDYGVVLGRGLRRVLREAARDPGLDPEIGAVRLALLRLLEEEQDPSRLASGVARLVSVALQIARLRPAPDPALAEWEAHLERALDELDAEHAAALAANASTGTRGTDELA